MRIRPRWHKIFSDLGGNLTRSMLVIASISIGLFALGIIATMYAVMSQDLRTGYAASNPANIQIQGGPFNQDVLDHVNRMPGVSQVMGTQEFNLRLETGPNEWTQISMHALPDLGSQPLNQLSQVAGSYPPGERQIVIEQFKFREANAQLGDTLNLETPGGSTHALKLVGIVGDQTVGSFDSGPGFFLAPVQGYVTPKTAEWLGRLPEGMYNTLYIEVDGDRGNSSHIQQVADEVRSDLEQNGYLVASTRTRGSFSHPNAPYVDALVGVLVVLGLFTIFLSGFLITNTLQALMKQQVQQIGIMKTLGGRRNQIVIIYLALILMFGILAAMIAIPLSAMVAFNRVGALAGEVNFIYRGPRLVPWVIGLQIGLAVLAPLLASLVPILQGSRISVQKALSGSGQNPTNAPGRISRLMARLRRFPRPLMISIRNTFRQKWRMLLTLLTLSLGGALFIGAFNVQVSMNLYIEQISRYFRGDVNLSLTRPYRIDRVQEALADVPGIKELEGWSATQAETVEPDGSTGETVQILAPPATSQLVQPILLEGRWILPGDQGAVTLNERFQERYPGLKVGDKLHLKINGRDVDWVVVGFFQLVGRSAGYIAYTDYNTLADLLGQANQASTYRIVADQVGMNEAQQTQLGQLVQEQLSANGIDVAEVTPGQSISTEAGNGFAILTAFLLFLAGLTALVGSIGLAGTMSMNVMERTREIGVMRAIGATNGILIRMVVIEGMLIGLMSWLLGSLLAFPISKLLSDSITQAIFGAPSQLGVTATGFIIWLVAVVVLSAFASILPARNATRLTIREVLAYE
jgi:putative ABC transport system permease protein